MTDYYPLVARAIAGLSTNTGEVRRALYERARAALVNQLRSSDPPLSEEDITRERLSLEEAIRKVEAAAAHRPHELLSEPALPPVDSGPSETPPGEPQGEPHHEPAYEQDPPHDDQQTDRETASQEDDASPDPSSERTSGDLHETLNEAAELGQASSQSAREARDIYDSIPEEATLLRRAPPSERDPVIGAGTPPPFDEADDTYRGSMRSYSGLLRTAVILIVLAMLASAAYWKRDTIAGLFTSKQQVTQPVRDNNAASGAKPKIADRIAPGGSDQRANSAPATDVAQKVVLYEEDPNDQQGKRSVGSVLWRTETISPGPGLAPELAIRGDVDIPERRMKITWSLRRNADKALPASHTIEILFTVPADFSEGGIANVPGVLMKSAEQTRGTPLAGLAVKVTTGYFLIGLSSVDTDMQRNLQLLKERPWFDVPIVYNNGKRAIIAIEKGPAGERVFEDALRAWGQYVP